MGRFDKIEFLGPNEGETNMFYFTKTTILIVCLK